MVVAIPTDRATALRPQSSPQQRRRKRRRPGNQPSSQRSTIRHFREAYRTAYATIYDHKDYAAAIDQLHALRHDDHPNVANLIGYSYRKLGDYRQSQLWYERALKADPNHVLTWNYYGLWQIEQGNRDQAQYHLTRIAAICGTDCEEYRSLAAALEKPPGTGLVLLTSATPGRLDLRHWPRRVPSAIVARKPREATMPELIEIGALQLKFLQSKEDAPAAASICSR